MAQVSWFSEAESKHFFLMQVCEEIAVQIQANSAIDTLVCLMVVSIFGTRIPMVYHGLSWFILVYHHVSTFKLPCWYPPSDFETNLADPSCMLHAPKALAKAPRLPESVASRRYDQPSFRSSMEHPSRHRPFRQTLKIIHMAVCQNLVPLVNIKIAGKWMFIPLKSPKNGINRY